MYMMKDEELFRRARTEGAVIMTKDSHFVELVGRHGPPPQIIHLTSGNTSNAELQRILRAALPEALRMLESGERLVEIGGGA
jgi:predicted nuclease of predicted toxin-antitoxin system